MSVYDQDKETHAKRIFISYSSIDRLRTSGLALLLEAMGHKVFHDHRTIKPGMKWKAALQDGLDDASAVMVFWTRHAARSEWVRKEYEYFTAQYPDRLLVPVLGDETPLTELLKTRQHADFVPVVNEVLEKKRRMKKEGAGAREIEQAVKERLAQEGVEVKTKHHRRMVFLFLGFGWLLSLLRYPWTWPQKAGSAAVEATSQATAGQLLILVVAAAIGIGTTYPIAKSVVEQRLPRDVSELLAENEDLRQLNQDLDRNNEELRAMDRGFEETKRALDDLGNEVKGLKMTGPPPGCITPESFEGCQTSVQNARLDLTNRLDEMSGRLYQISSQNVADGLVTSEVIETGTQEIGDCDSAPEPVHQPEPEYPRSARLGVIEGNVTVQATIDIEGNVTDVVADGDEQILATAASDAVSRWKFVPCTIDDQTVAASFKVKFEFSLHN